MYWPAHGVLVLATLLHPCLRAIYSSNDVSRYRDGLKVADMELKFITDRQRAGIEAARAEGIYRGRRKNVDDYEIRRRVADGASKAEVLAN